jgi:chromosome segregation ATPase
MKSLNNELKDKNDEVKRLNNHLDEKNREIKKIKQQLAQKNLGIRWLKIQVEKNNLINQGHYQFMAMGAMGMGIAVTGSYLLSKCI